MVGGSIGKVLLIFKHMRLAAYSARTMSHASENLLCIGKRFSLSSPQHNSVSENWLKFKLTLTKGIQDYVPHKKSTPKYKLPWITSAIKRHMRLKDRLHKKALKSHKPKHWDE
jgi:hypothetical protein